MSVENVFETEALEPQSECLQLLGQLVNVRLQRLQHCLICASCFFAHTYSGLMPPVPRLHPVHLFKMRCLHLHENRCKACILQLTYTGTHCQI